MKFPYQVQKKTARSFRTLREFRTKAGADKFLVRLINRFKRNVYRVREV